MSDTPNVGDQYYWHTGGNATVISVNGAICRVKTPAGLAANVPTGTLMEKPKAITDPCEWNPKANRAAYSNEVHATAKWIVGAKGEWRLCDDCAALPQFKRFKKFTEIPKR